MKQHDIKIVFGLPSSQTISAVKEVMQQNGIQQSFFRDCVAKLRLRRVQTGMSTEVICHPLKMLLET